MFVKQIFTVLQTGQAGRARDTVNSRVGTPNISPAGKVTSSTIGFIVCGVVKH